MIAFSILEAIFLILIPVSVLVTGDQVNSCSCSCLLPNQTKEADFLKNLTQLYVPNNQLVTIDLKKLHLISGIPYFLLNSLPQNVGRSFYGSAVSPSSSLWTTNKDVNDVHMQWDLLPTEYGGYYQIRRSRDARVLTGWGPGRTLVTLGDGKLSLEASCWQLQMVEKGKFIIRNKLSPNSALKIDLTNQEYNSSSKSKDLNFMWEFQPAYTYGDYFVHFSISNLEYAVPHQNILTQRQKRVGILSETVIDNPSDSTIEDRLSRSEKKIQRYQLTVSNSYKKGKSSAEFGSSAIRSSTTDRSSVTMANTKRSTRTHTTSSSDTESSKSGSSTSDSTSSSATKSNENSETNVHGTSNRVQSDHTFGADLNAGISADFKLFGKGASGEAKLGFNYKYYHSNIDTTNDQTTKYRQAFDSTTNAQNHESSSFNEHGSSHTSGVSDSNSNSVENMKSVTTGNERTHGTENVAGSSSGTTDEQGRDDGVIWEKSEEVTYAIERNIRVPPYSGVSMSSYVDWVDGLELPYTANVVVTVQGMRSLNEFTNCAKVEENSIEVKLCGKNCQKGFLDADGVEWFLRQFDNSLLEDPFVKSESTVVLRTSGMFIGSYGINAVYSARNIRPSSKEPQRAEEVVKKHNN